MRYALLALVFASILRADCAVSVFPEQTTSLRFIQKSKTAVFDSEAEMTWSDRQAAGDRVRWTLTFTVEGREPKRSTSEFRCSEEGITPVSKGTVFTGFQYGNNLETGTGWKWT